MQYIGLLDCNNFFVSCERIFRPDLLRKPVVVLSGNDGCVVARSNEVKELGVPMGIPYFQVKKELAAAETAIFSANFALYRDISARVMEVLKNEVDVIEQYSVDESFFTIEGSVAEVECALKKIKQTVQQQVGVPVSLGAARSKTIAKYASEKEKRGSGICILEGIVWKQEIKNILLSQVWGIGTKTSQKMRSHGLVTVADLLAADTAVVARLFGVEGVRKREELGEQSVYKIGDRQGAQKSIMSTRSFKETTTEKTVIADALAYHVDHVAAELRSKKMKAKYLSVIAGTSRHGDWMLRGGSREIVLDVPINDTRELLSVANQLLAEMYEPGVPYKKAGVVVGMLQDATHEQLDLFTETTSAVESGNVLMEVFDAMNMQFGKETITIGRSNQSAVWGSSKQLLSPNYTTKWDQIATVTSK